VRVCPYCGSLHVSVLLVIDIRDEMATTVEPLYCHCREEVDEDGVHGARLRELRQGERRSVWHFLTGYMPAGPLEES
jgi:hypothetical protein